MSQNEKVKKYMEDHGSITSMQAFEDLRITRLSARIHDLKEEGIKVGSTTEVYVNAQGEKSRYARYYLIGGK